MRLTTRAVLWIGGAVIVVLATLVWVGKRGGEAIRAKQPAARAELPRRVTVEVLNTTRVPGMARVAREAIRHAGLDVVAFRNADSALGHPESNEILVRRGDTTGVGRIKDAMGGAVVVDAPDRDQMVDLTVLIGAAFAQARAPARP